MKLATKKFFHNVLAIVVSVCMVCTLTPSVAWATSDPFFEPDYSQPSGSNGGSVGTDTTTIQPDIDSTEASGTTDVKAKVYDANFKFTTLTPGTNYVSVDKFVEIINANPLTATFNKGSLPDSFNVSWYVQEIIDNPDYDPDQEVSSANPKTIRTGTPKQISSYDCTNPAETYEDQVPTFKYPGGLDPSETRPDALGLQNGKMYEFSVVLKDGSGEEASATTKITILPDYPEIKLNGVGDGVANSADYVAEGSIYVAFSIPLAYPELTVSSVDTSSTDPVFTALNTEAGKNGEEVGSATRLALTDMDNLPEGQAPYLSDEGGNGLTVLIPLPAGHEATQGTIKVYGYNQTEGEAAPSAKTYDGEVVEVKREDGSTYLAAAINLVGTGATLGSFAIGTPMGGSCTFHISADQGGLVTPGGDEDGLLANQALTKEAEFAALAYTTGYVFVSYEVRIGSATAQPVANLDVSGNLLKFKPTSFGVADGDDVYIHANFQQVPKPAEGVSPNAYNVTGTLQSSDGANGDMTIGPAQSYSGAPGKKTVRMNQSNVGLDSAVNDYAGLYIEFSPAGDSTIDYVKVNGEALAFDYSAKAVMIGALDGPMNIEAGYRKLAAGETAPTPSYVDVTGKLDTSEWPAGYIRAMLGINGAPSQSEFTHAYATPSGGTQTISVFHTRNYRVHATEVDAKGVATDVTDRMVTGDTLDTITVYNITNPVTIIFNYVPKEAEITGTTGPGGSGSVVIDPTQQPNANSAMKAKARMRARSVRAGSSVSIEGANQALENGNRARITATPDAGYELGRVEINGTNVTQYFKPHYVNGVLTHLTMTVYRTETGDVPSNAGKWLLAGYEDWGLYDSVTDEVVPIESALVSLVMTFNEKVPTSPTYQTIRTHVEGVGGTITPGFKAEQNTTATVQFFPDDTYKVDAYKIDNGSWVTVGNGPESLKCEVPVSIYDHDVTVRFKAGTTQNMPKSYTITPLASAGGAISPGEPVKVYENDSFSFSILPKTGYVMASQPELEGSGTLEVKGYTCTVKNVTSDCNLSVSFLKSDASTDPTHIVRAKYNSEGGTVKPSSPFTVADGADASFTFLPNDGWYVRGVYVVDSTTPEANEENEHGINLAGSVQQGRLFSLRDIQADTVIEVVFAELSGLPDDEKEKHKPPTLNPGDTFTLDPTKAAEIGEGATISPSLSDLEFVKAKDNSGNVIQPEHAAAGSDITIIIASGYDLDDKSDNGGISIKNGDKDVTGNISIKPAGDGLYEVKIPAENVTPDMKIIVKTKKDDASQGVVNTASVTVKVDGQGAITPAGIDGKVKVESGKSQTFSFIPAQGWKLHRVYVNDENVVVTGNTYTIHNVTGNDTVLQAVFVEGVQQPPVVTHDVTVVASGDSSLGSVYPSGVTKVADGAALSILVEPAAGYKAIAREGSTQIPLVGNTIELSNIKANRTINVSFESIKATDFLSLTVTHSSGGSVSPSGNTLIARGESQTLSILPDAGKAVKAVWLTRGDNTSGANVSTSVRTTSDGKGIIYTTPSATEKMAVYVDFCDASDTNRPNLPTGDVIRQPTGKDTYHEMTAFVAGGGGTVLPTYAKVANGATLTYSIVALDGYHLKSATYNDENAALTNNNTTFVTPPVNKDSELRVVFEKDSGNTGLEQYYTVFASAKSDSTKTTAGAVAGGSISPAGPVTVSGGGSQSFTIMPDPNCKVSSIVVTNRSTGTKTEINDFKGSSYTLFGVNNDLNFMVTFTALKAGETGPSPVLTHSINASSSLNGSISPAGTRLVDHGGDAMFSFVPWDGYKLSYIVVDGLNIPASYISNMQYTFPKVTEDHTIHAVYIGVNEQATDFATVNVTSNRNGTVSPGGAVLVKKGDSLSIDATPFLRYKITDIQYNGTPIASSGFDYTNSSITTASLPYNWSNGQLTLKNVTDDCNVEVTFSENKNAPGAGEEIPDYEKIGTTIGPAGSGSTSIQPNPIFVEEPPTVVDDPLQKKMDVSIIPEEGKIAEEIVVKYGDGTEERYNSTTNPTAKDIYEKGYITVSTDKGDVDIDIKFRDLTTGEKNDIQNGYLNPATYLEVNVTYSAGGTVGPAGTIKVAKGSNLTLQMIPNANYEVASVTVDGANRTSAVFRSTRTYIEKNIQTNKDINVGFGFVKSDEPEATYDLTANVVNSDTNSGTVSPAETKVREGSNQVIYFLPAPGYKIGKVTVTRGSEVQEYGDYNSPSMSIRNIASDVKVEVEYVQGQNTWTVKSVPLTVEVGTGKGDVSPKYAELPVGSAAEVNFFPDDEWMTSYYTLNGQTYTLPQNVSSWPVTPDPAEGAENVMRVFFERYDINDVDQVVNVKLIDSGDGQFHGSASPSQATVPYGGSTTFYVYPEAQGYTIDYVRFNGADQKAEGVMHANGSNKQNYSVNSSGFSTTGSPSSVTSTDADRLSKANNTYYSVYSVTLNDVVTSGTLEVKFKKIPIGNGTFVTTNSHKMTVTSTGGGMVNPIGEVLIPEGETLDILTTAFESYYLYSVIKTDSAGKTDLTGTVEGRVAKATMGGSDCTVEVTFNRINQKPDADVHVSLTKATYNGKEITDQVEVGAYYDPFTEKLVPIQRNTQGVLCDSDGNPISYVRGGSYEFYFTTDVKGANGRDLTLSSATYAGKSQSIIPGANYLANVVLNASGGFELEFRELEEGEQPLNPAQGFTVYVQAYGDGTITPAGPFTRQPGGSVEIALEGNSDNIAVSAVFLEFVNDFGEPQVEDVPVSEYADGTYRLTGIDRDYTINVIFEEFSIVRVEWDNGLGFVTPNHAPGSYIYRPLGTESMPFLVAPYVDSELVSVLSGESHDNLVPREYSDDEKYAEDLNAELGLNTQNGGISTMSMADAPTTIVQPQTTNFAQVYGFTAPLADRTTYVQANFKSTKVEQNHTITVQVPSGHGTVSPSGPSGVVEVPHGGEMTFTASPEAGYTLISLTIDGVKVPAQNPVVFRNVTEDHTVVFEFGLPQAGSTGSGADRLVRIASRLAQTGDLTGPVVGALLIVAALGLATTAISYIRRQQRRRRRMQAMQ